MGPVTLPISGRISLDAQIVITVERHPSSSQILRPLWAAVAAGSAEALTSELTLLETAVLPLRQQRADLITAYDQFFQQPGIRLVPIDRQVLRGAAELRARTQSLRTPDAIHVFTALASGCQHVVTNDADLRRLSGVGVVLLSDLLSETA